MSNISVNAGHGGLALEGAELAKLEALENRAARRAGASPGSPLPREHAA